MRDADLGEEQLWQTIAIEVRRGNGRGLREVKDAVACGTIYKLCGAGVLEHTNLSVQLSHRDDVVIAIAVEINAGHAEPVQAVALRDGLNAVRQAARNGLLGEQREALIGAAATLVAARNCRCG